jgi:hypothetical protein
MSCYVRHLTDFMEALGLENTSENRKRLDSAIRSQIGMTPVNNCPEIWAKLKPILANESKKAVLLKKIKAKGV